MLQDLLPELNPAVLVLSLAVLAPVLTVLCGVLFPRTLAPVAILTTLAAFLAVCWSFSQPDATFNVTWAETYGLRWHLTLDGLARLYALLATGIGLLVVTYATVYLPRHLHHQHRSEVELPRFFGFLLLFMAAMTGLVMAQDVILLFVFWDLTAIASFYLIGYDREDDSARSAALMSLLVTGVSAVFVLIGSLILARDAGSFQLPEIFAAGLHGPDAEFATALIAIGALAKSAQVPLHFWLPRAMAAPTPVSAYLHSAAMVAAGVFLVGRFYPVIGQFETVLNGMIAIGMLSMVVGGLVALSKDGFKQVLAYSTISQYGYVVFLLGLGGEKGVLAATFYVLAHALVKSALFLTAGTVTEATGARQLSAAGGLWKTYPLLALGSGAAAAGLIALPLTIGFFKDELYFAAAHQRGLPFTIFAVIGATLTFAYIARWWISIFLGKPKGLEETIPPLMLAPILILGVLTVVFGVWLNPVIKLVDKAATVSLGEVAHLHIAYHFDTRAENLMAVLTWVLGAGLVLTYSRWKAVPRFVSSVGAQIGPERIYHWSLMMLERFSDAIHRVEVRDLRSRVATILLPAGLLVLLAVLTTPNDNAFTVGDIERSDLPVITMLLATALAAVAVAFPRDHLRLALTSSAVGFSLALIYAFLGAPDVALVAVLVETILGIVILGLLLLMPSTVLRIETRLSSRQRQGRRDIVYAVVAGAMAFLIVWGALSRPAPATWVIDQQEQLTKAAHGNDIVTVILADFRGFDTLGEVTVIALVLIGITSLVRKGKLR